MDGISGIIISAIYRTFDWLGVGAIVVGFVIALWRAAIRLKNGRPRPAFVALRNTFARAVLIGLELLVAADLIRTIAVEPTMANLLVLALLVVLRTFLSWALEVEIEGRWPWNRPEEMVRT